MDVQNGRGSEGNTPEANLVGEYPLAAAAAAQGGRGVVLMPNADNVVILPAGATLDDLSVQGRDILITMPDGRVFIIPDGAVYVPQIVLGDVAVPPLNLAALLTGHEPQPAAGAVRSSGGNFADPTGPIQPAYGLGDLLPYTELSFAVEQKQEVLPGLIDDEPEVIIETPDNPAGAINATATVDEEGLPARDGEPAGTASETDAETTSGTIVFNSPDGTSAVLINGEEVTAVGQTFTSPFGTMTITSIDLDAGEIGFSYTLADNLLGVTADGFFTMTVVDTDGDAASATLQINVIDDGPIGFADTNTVAAGTFGPIEGNVITNDIPGADGFSGGGATAVTGFASATATGAPGSTISGAYGELTLNADGTYTYTRFSNTPGGVEDHFTYSIVDSDGTAATNIQLTINIEDSSPGIDLVPEIGAEGTEVNENQLPPTTDTRSEEAPGSQFVSGSETTSGTITFHSTDGVSSVSLGGTAITPGSLPQVVASDATGTLTVVAYAYDPATGNGSFTYAYTLTDNTVDTDGSTVSFDIAIVDSDGDTDTGTLDIRIIDDLPTATDDTAVSVAEDAVGTVGGNVLANDTRGADGATVTSVTIGGTAYAVAAVGTTNVSTANGAYTFDAAGNWTFDPTSGLDQSGGNVDASFTYTLTDGDGDTDPALQPISITDGAGPSAGEPISLTVDDENLSGGSNENTPVTDAGNIVFTPGSDAIDTIAFGTNLGGLDASLTWVRVDDITITGSDGATLIVTLELTRTGDTATVTATLSDNYDAHPTIDADDLKALGSVDVVATDSDGDTATSSVSVSVSDDVPTAADDTAVSVAEDAAGTVGGNVLANDTQGADGASMTSVTIGGVAHAIAAVGTTNVSTANGAYTFDAAGNWTFDPTSGLDQSGGNVDASFTYTLTDGDGDTDPALQPISITDGAGPSAGEPISLTVDDENLSGGSNENTPVTDAGDIVFTPGSDAIDTIAFGTNLGGLDASLTWVRVDDITITGSDGATLIVTLELTRTGDTATVTATLSDNYDAHPTIDADDLKALGSVDVVATDIDGDTATSSVSVSVSDDVPTAADDGASQATENVAFTINVFGNDVFGADGVDTANAAKVFVSSQASQGTVTYDTSTGLFTYTPDAGAGSTTTVDSFEYTIVDGDGDTSTAAVNITLQPDSEPQGGERVATVDDDGLTGGNPASAIGDIDANAGDDPADTSEASFTGTLAFGVGNDTPATITFDASLDGSTAVIGLETVTYSVSGSILTATITGGARNNTPLFQIEILDSQTGEYHVTLLTNVLNDGGPNNEAQNALASIDFTVTDSEGDTASTNLGIVFNDDAPTAVANTDGVTEGQSVSGNVVTNDVPGADGLAAAPTGAVTGIASVNESTNQTSANGSGNFVLAGEFGTLTLGRDGSYTYQSNANAITANEQDVFQYTIVDSDGDTSTATLTIDLTNVGLNADNQSKTVQEAALDLVADDRSGTVNDDLVAGSVNGSNPGAATETVSGTLNVTGATSYVLVGSAAGAFGQIQINSNGTYTYTLADPVDGDTTTPAQGGNNGNNTYTGNGLETFTYEASDADGNTVQGTITISIVDDVPTAADDSAVSVAEDAVGTVGGNVLANDTQGADGASMTSVTIGGVAHAIAAVGTTNVNTANGAYTFDAAGNWTFNPTSGLDQSGGNVDASFTYTLTDGDGDIDPALQPISITDGAGPTGGDTLSLEVDDDALPDGNNSASTDEISSGALTFTAGSDALTSFAFGNVSGLDASLSWTRVSDTLIEGRDGGTLIVSLTLGAPGSIAAGASGDVTVTATLSNNYDSHPTVTADDLKALGSVSVVASDQDGDSATGTVSLSVSDDVPTLSVSGDTSVVEGATASGTWSQSIGADQPGAQTVVVFGGSDYALGAGIATGKGTLTVNANGTWSFVSNNNLDNDLAQSVSFTVKVTDADNDVASDTQTVTITDGAGPTGGDTLSLEVDDDALSDGNNSASTDETSSGALTFTAGSDALTSFAFGNVSGLDASLSWTRVSDTLIEGRDGGTLIVSLTLSAPGSIAAGASGDVTVTATLSNNYDSHPTFTADDLKALGPVSVVASDQDGDSATGTVSLSVSDDVPVIIDGPDPLVIENEGTVSGTAVFDYSIGADNRTTFSSSNSDFFSIALAGTVASNAITSPTVTWSSETATSAVFNVSFSYQSGSSTVNATGTLSFDKSAGTYTVDLDAPIQAVTISTISNSTFIQGYEVGTSTPDNTSPLVAVAQVAPNLFVQFTGVSEPGAGTGANNLHVGSDTVFTAGEVLSQSAEWVSISGTANGVGGDTMGKGEVIDLDFFTSNPFGNTSLTPTAEAQAIFFKLDGVGNNEDFIVVLKLVDADDPSITTTKAVMVENADIIKGSAGPGIYSGVSLDNNDGLVVIESNDYNGAGENWVIVGAQFTPTDEGITGTAINLNGAVGAAGGSTGTQNWSADTNDTGFKVSDIGIVSTNTLAQDATLNFNVTLVDVDGDKTATQQLQVSVTNSVPPIALDLDGDGVEYLSLSADVTHDYGAGLVQTAWVAADDGLLAHDTGNGLDIVFTDDAAGASTDLEGLRLAYDSNGDGKLTAADADFGNFGVWQDANSNGIVDEGEYQSLLKMGITSIDLTSNQVSSVEAGGDVVVHGTAQYTMNGTTYSLADVSFATTSASDRIAARTTEIAAVSLAAAGFMASEAAQAQSLPTVAVEVVAAALQTFEAPVPEAPVSLPEAPHETAVVTLLEDQASQPEQAEATTHQETDAPDGDTQHGLGDVSQHDPAPELSAPDEGATQSSTPAISFGGSDSSMMEALLLAASPKQADASEQGANADIPAVKEAIAESAGQQAVDAMIDHFAGNDASHAPATSGAEGLDHALGAMLAGAGADGVHAGMAAGFEMAAMAAAAEAHSMAVA